MAKTASRKTVFPTEKPWGMSDERVFMENLLTQRLHFFVILYSLILNCWLNAKAQWQLRLIFTLGFVICFLLGLALARYQQRVNSILESLERDYPEHPLNISNKAIGDRIKRGSIGWIIPIVCCTSLLAGMVCAWFNWLPL